MKKWQFILLFIVCLFLIASIISKSIELYSGSKEGIAVIAVKGAIGINDYFNQGIDPDAIVDYIKNAEENKNVKAILVHIDSPGGTVVGSEKIANALKKVSKVKVAFIDSQGTSGAYWVASAADRIVADPMSVTGSIGVSGSYLEFNDLLDKYGIKYRELKAGRYKETGSPWKNLTLEERELLQKTINQIYDFFVSEVATNRNIGKERMFELSTGEIYLGKEALQLGLVDYIGDKEFAINITQKLANITKFEIIEYKKEKTILDLLNNLINQAFYYLGVGLGDKVGIRDKIDIYL